MFSHTRTALQQFDNQHDFERMAADILNALGYKEVVPIAPRGGSDGGRDITFTTESGGKGLACVTLRQDIEVKFKQDFAQRAPGEYEKYIFFCTAYLSAKQKLDFIGFCIGTLQAELISYDIEALRSLLDATFPSIRERYLGIKDDQREAFESLRENLRKENEARFLLEKAHNTTDLVKASNFVKQAEKLWSPIRQEEYRLLGIRNAQVVIGGLPLELSIEHGPTYRVYTKDTLASYLRNALTYLEETVSDAEFRDAEGLLYLACMYGYQKQFHEMITTIEKALKIDQGIQEEFRRPPNLEILLLACGSDGTKLDQVVKKLNIPSITRETFCRFIIDFDLKDFNGYIKWVAVKRPNKPGARGVHTISICPPYIQNGGLVSAYSQVFETGQIEGITASPQFVPVETLYDILLHSFNLVLPFNRE